MASHSSIQISRDYILAPCMYFCTSGLVGSNKTGGVKLICDSYMQMEEMYKSVEPSYKSHYNQSMFYLCLKII